MKHHKGFTLIELMVTIAVIAVLASLAAPSFRTQIQRNQLASQVRDFSAVLQESRSKAVLFRRNFTLTLGAGVPGGAQSMDDTRATASWAPNSDKVAVANGDNNLVFNLMGAITAPTDQCYLFSHVQNAQISQAVRVGRNGTVTVIKTQTTC